ncbi:hypothetical protein BH11BAC1_BH11BAC1_07020 [soil metagenome]
MMIEQMKNLNGVQKAQMEVMEEIKSKLMVGKIKFQCEKKK